MTPHKTLELYFGFKKFRPGQLEIIHDILNYHDVLAILPTGGGKSLCYQIPGLIMPGLTIVISPLISLMKDQVDALQRKKITATFINSSLTKNEIKKRLQDIINKKYKFLYLSPERLLTPTIIQTMQSISISLLAVDEAHCISMWGHDFRPEYCQINQFINKLSSRPVIAAFTATATSIVRKEIISSLKLNSPQIFLNSFRRANLNFHVHLCSNSFEQELSLLILLKNHLTQSGIIYAATRYKTEYLARLIKHYWGQNFPVQAYHAGLDSKQRAQIQDQFLNHQLQVITATTAFGMGVDKSDVRWVIHYQIPANLENYYQEAGRAGRDGQLADCYLLFNPVDLEIQKALINKSQSINSKLAGNRLKKLQQIISYAQNKTCRQLFILRYFDEVASNCGQCDICRHTQLELNLVDQQATQTLQNYLAELPIQALNQRLIKLIAILRPRSKADFLKIPGIGTGWVEKWYNQVFQILERNQFYVHDLKTTHSTIPRSC